MTAAGMAFTIHGLTPSDRPRHRRSPDTIDDQANRFRFVVAGMMTESFMREAGAQDGKFLGESLTLIREDGCPID